MAFTRTVLAGTATFAALGCFLAAGTAISYVKHVSAALPDHRLIERWRPMEGTVIAARDGTVLGAHAKENREFALLDSIPARVVDAFVAAEDGAYWSHSGIDPAAILRAAAANVAAPAGARPEGGSTITQQVVKNVILTNDRTIERKVKEAVLAVRADRDVGKKRIMEVYLNEIYFGAGAYGVSAAAKAYFGKDLADLSLAETALLAGLPKAPSTANPFTSPARAKARRAYVLGRMVAEGMIGEDEARLAGDAPLPEARQASVPAAAGHAFWYAQEAVRRELVAEFGSEAVYGAGAKIVTTVDADLQARVHGLVRRSLVEQDRRSGWRGPLSTWKGAPDWSSPALAAPPGAEGWPVAVVMEAGRDAVLSTAEGEVTVTGRSLAWATSRKRADAVLSPGDVVLVADLGDGFELVQVPELQAAAVVMDPRTGAVLALDGGFSHETSEFNRATQALRQTGSAFKPFVYLAALEMGYDAMSPVLDSPIAIDQGPGQGDWRPEGGSAGGMGLITLRKSLETSRNMSTVRLLHDVGIDRALSVAHRAGLPTRGTPSLSMALGAAEATPLEMAAAYAAFANGGRKVEPTLFADRARDVSGDAPVLDPVSVAQLSSMLEGVVVSGTARAAFQGFPHRIAAKTGTTNDARDAWLAAYGPGVVVVVWIGRDDHKPLPAGASGGASAAPLARAVLEAAGGAVSFPDFTLPDGAAAVRADRETGAPSEDGDVVEIVRQTGG